jgi:hypothetical protein
MTIWKKNARSRQPMAFSAVTQPAFGHFFRAKLVNVHQAQMKLSYRITLGSHPKPHKSPRETRAMQFRGSGWEYAPKRNKSKLKKWMNYCISEPKRILLLIITLCNRRTGLRAQYCSREESEKENN